MIKRYTNLNYRSNLLYYVDIYNLCTFSPQLVLYIYFSKYDKHHSQLWKFIKVTKKTIDLSISLSLSFTLSLLSPLPLSHSLFLSISLSLSLSLSLYFISLSLSISIYCSVSYSVLTFFISISFSPFFPFRFNDSVYLQTLRIITCYRMFPLVIKRPRVVQH